MKIRKRKNPSGEFVWQLDLGRGKGQRKTFPSETKAKTALAQEKRRLERHGEMINDIMPAEMAQIVAARNRLLEVGSNIPEAVDFFLANGKVVSEPLLLPELVQRFRDSRKAKGLSPEYIETLDSSLGSLAEMFPLAKSHELTSKQVQVWNKNPLWAAKTRNNYLGNASAMYEWAMRPTQGHARSNPCVGVERDEKVKKGKRPSLTVEQAQQLLEVAVEQKRWRVLAYVVLCMFGGIRPEEASYEGMLWEDVNLEEAYVYLSDEVVKTGPGRTVDLTPQAVAWLRLIPADLRKGSVVPSKSWVNEWTVFRYRLGWRVMTEKTRVRRCLPIVTPVHSEWPNSVLRHTYASYHFAEHQNEHLLQAQMGHESPKMIREVYKGVRTRKEAAEFWKIAPLDSHKSITSSSASDSKGL